MRRLPVLALLLATLTPWSEAAKPTSAIIAASPGAEGLPDNTNPRLVLRCRDGKLGASIELDLHAPSERSEIAVLRFDDDRAFKARSPDGRVFEIPSPEAFAAKAGRRKLLHARFDHLAAESIAVEFDLKEFSHVGAPVFAGCKIAESEPAPAQVVSTEVESDEKLNYRFRAPPKPWFKFDAASVNAEATLGFMRAGPAMTFMLIAENVGEGAAEFPTDGLAEIVTSALKSKAKNVNFISREPRMLNGMDGLVLITDAKVANLDVTFVHWVYSHNGFLYQLILWGDQRVASREQILEQAESVFAGFEQVDSRQIAITEGEPLTEFRSDRFGYRLETPRDGWDTWPDVRSDLPSAEIGGTYGADAGFAVIPVSIGKTEVSLDGLTEALLAEMGFEYPGGELESVTPLEGSSVPGYAISARRMVDEIDYAYKMRVLRTSEHGYLLAAWRLAGALGDGAILTEILDAVALTPAHPSDPEALLGELAVSQGRILSAIAAHHFVRSDPATSAVLFDRAFTAAPTDADVLAGWISAVSNSAGPEAALRLFHRHLDVLGDNLAFLSWEPYLEASIGNFDAAVDGYDKLFARGYRATEDFVQYAHSLRALGRLDQAGEFLAARYSGPPFDEQLALLLVDIYQEADQLSESMQICEELLRRGFKTADVYFVKAITEYGLGSYRDAKHSLEEASRRNPADPEIRQYLDHVSGILGEGTNTALKNAIEPVPIPDTLLGHGSPSDVPASAKDFGVYFTYRVMAIAFDAGKDHRITRKIAARILDRRGAAHLKTWVISYDPFAEEIFVNELRVLDETGKVVAEGNSSDYYVVDNTLEGMTSQQRDVHIPISGLEPGRLVELTVTRRRLTPPERMPWFRHLFAYRLPTARSSVVLTGSIDSVAHVEHNGAELEAKDNRLTWTVRQPAVGQHEPYAEPPIAYLPAISLTDADADWKDLGAGYLEDIADRLEPDASVSAVAEKVLANLAPAADRIQALVEHVQLELDYSAVEFGRRAWIPNPPASIVHAGQGDCKDHALMLYHLLRAQEIPAHLALVRMADPIESALPSLDQFDHMIVFVPGLSNGGFVDATDKSHDPVALPPAGLADRWALVLSEAGSALKKIPSYPTEGNVFESRRMMQIEEDGSVSVEETVTLSGYSSIYLRPALRDADSRTQQIIVQNVFSGWIGNLQVHELSTKNLARPSLPLVLHVRYTVNGAFARNGDELRGRIPGGLERGFLIAPHLQERKSPFRIAYPVRSRSNITIQPPPGFDPGSIKAEVAKGSDMFFTWDVDSKIREGNVELRFDLVRRPGAHPSSAYAKLQQSVKKLTELLAPDLGFGKTATRP